MQKIAVWSVKGGCGKSTISAGLCYALRDMGYKVGYQEVDTSGQSGHKAFRLSAAPKLGLDTANSRIIPPVVDGIRLYCLASRFAEEAAVGWRGSDIKRKLSNGEEIIDKGRRGFIEETLTRGVDWKDTECIIYDLPPSTSDETFAYFDFIVDLQGVILISQPSQISVIGLMKTIDFLKTKQMPICGIVENMAYFLTPDGQSFYPFVSPGVDVKKLAQDKGIAFLVSIPQVDSMDRLKPYFDELADKVIHSKGKVYKQEVLSTRAKLERAVIKKGLGL